MVGLANVPTNEVSGFLINDGKKSNATCGDQSYLRKVCNSLIFGSVSLYGPKICIKYRKHGSSSFLNTFNCM